MNLFGAIEAGGTKFICLVGSDPQHIQDEVRFSTTTPAETLAQVVDFFKRTASGKKLVSIGIGCFGPLDLDQQSPTFGSITSTPKPGWANTRILTTLQNALQVPIAIDTDVNAAALAEYTWGAAQFVDSCIYLTIGTGVGGGGIINNGPLHGLVHPEMGHISLPHDRETDPFEGICPFHGDCFEGLASGPALNKRWGQPAETLPEDHPAWELEAHYIALALASYICVLSPKRIILGGGVMQKSHLFPLIRKNVIKCLNGYVQSPEILENIDEYIQPPALGNRAGVLGALALAQFGWGNS